MIAEVRGNYGVISAKVLDSSKDGLLIKVSARDELQVVIDSDRQDASTGQPVVTVHLRQDSQLIRLRTIPKELGGTGEELMATPPRDVGPTVNQLPQMLLSGEVRSLRQAIRAETKAWANQTIHDSIMKKWRDDYLADLASIEKRLGPDGDTTEAAKDLAPVV